MTKALKNRVDAIIAEANEQGMCPYNVNFRHYGKLYTVSWVEKNILVFKQNECVSTIPLK